MKGVCFFGDGTVLGIGDGLPLGGQPGWPGRLLALERLAGRPFLGFNLGVPGDTSGALLCRWRAEAELRAPACDGDLGLVFSFGREDMAEIAGEGIRVPLMESVLNVERLMTEARTIWPVLWVGPPPLRPRVGPVMSGGRWHRFSNMRVRMLNDAYRDVAERLFIPYLDLFALFDDDVAWDRDLGAGDGIHPGPQGCARLAEAVSRWPAWREWMDGIRPAEPPPPTARQGDGWRPLAH